jgi:hypothetical protein
VVAFDSFALPKADNWVHGATDDFSRRSVAASAHPLFMSVFLIVKLSHEFAIVPACRKRYKLYSRNPWSALPVTKLFFPTAIEKTGCPWGGVQMIDSSGPLRHCDLRAIWYNDLSEYYPSSSRKNHIWFTSNPKNFCRSATISLSRL